MMRRVVALVVVGALVVGMSGCAGQETPDGAATEPVKIGAILSLTGTYAALGEAEKKALELEAARVNDAGGIDGRQIELIIEDDGTDEAKAVAAAAKLIEQDEVIAVIGASGTGQSMAIRGDVQRAGIPQISMAGGTVITAEFDENVFQTPWSNTIVVPYVLEAIKASGVSRIAVLSDTGGYGKDGLAVIEASAPKAGLSISVSETFNPGDTDLSAQLVKIKGSDAQAMLLWTAGKEAALAVKGARDMGITLPLYGGSGQARTEFASGAGPASDGFVFGTGRSLIPENWGEGTPQYEAVSDFASRFQGAYGEAPDIFAGHAFDAFTIVVDSLGRAGADAQPAELRDAIEATSGLPGFGGTFTFSPTDHNGLTTDDLALYRFEGGQWVLAK